MIKKDAKGAAHRAKNELMKSASMLVGDKYKLVGDKELQPKGKIDKAKRAAREPLGDAKDAAKRIHNP
jgi:hypothetical protein